MQATITRPYQGSASNEGSAVRVVTGLVITLLAVAAFMVTREGSSAQPAATWDQRVHLIATSEAVDGTVVETTCTGYLTGDGRVMTSHTCVPDPRYLGDEVTVVHDPAGAGTERSAAATTGLILGDHLYVDLASS
jgi:hypothetical protein